MVNALVKLNEDTNRVLNSVKAIYGLKDKGEAIEFVVEKFSQNRADPDFKESFLSEIKKSQKEKSIKVDNLSTRYNL